MQYTVKASAIILALALAACSNDNSEQNKTQDTAAETAEAPDAAANEAASELDAFAQENLAFLEENKSKEGVEVTETGLQYKVIETGTGATPTADDYVSVHYAGRLIDGSQFDSSYDRGEPNTFPAGRLIKGWTEALTMMPVGSKWELVIPAELGYGKRGAGGVIPPNATLVFDVELLAIKSEEEAKAEEEARRAAAQAEMDARFAAFKVEQETFLSNNAKQDGVQVTESGLQYRVIEAGTGGKSPSATSKVTVHYAGKLIDGTEFDSSYKRGQPIDFPLNGVIPGWTEGLQLMQEGDKYEFFIPYDLGYGERGSGRNIPPFATLIFTVELLSVDS